MSAYPASAKPAATPAHPGRVLLVEDDADLAAYLGERLRDFVPVTIVGSAEAALQELALRPFDIVVSDVFLPHRSGLDLCRAVRNSGRLGHVPVLLISAGTHAAGRANAVAAGAVDYLVKPFGFDTLRRAIALAWPAIAARLAPVASQATPSESFLAIARARLHDADFGVSEWAAAAALSERQLRRRILAATGHAPLAWLREQRLQRVRRLIDDGACSNVRDAGLQAGLHNQPYLQRLYRARFGSTGARLGAHSEAHTAHA